MIIKEHIPLREHTTFRVGGPARFFADANSDDELREAVLFARAHSAPIFILGGGSNLLARDEGFEGMVIKISIPGIEYTTVDSETVEVAVGAGVSWDALVEDTVRRGLPGLENLSFIPGTVGAAPVQNIGAYGVEVKSAVLYVDTIHTETLKERRFSVSECDFGYRSSFFKKPEGRSYIITRVTFLLKKDTPLTLGYRDVAEYIKTHNINNPTLADIRNCIIDIRTKKLPSVAEYGTAGSFFKNPIISVANFKKLSERFPGLPGHPVDEGVIKVSAAWILDKVCGFKGYREGSVGVYKNQALVIVNFSHATSKEVSAFAQKMSDCVLEKTGIIIEPEVVYV